MAQFKVNLVSSSTILACALLAVGCAKKEGAALLSDNTSVSTPEFSRPASFNMNAFAFDKVVCDPFDTDTAPQSGFGLKADLFFLADGKKTDRTVFLPSLDVRLRPADKGFANILGEPVKDSSGEALRKDFGLHMKASLRLAPEQEAGLYEFALLNDDSAIIKFRAGDGNYRTLIDNSGENPIRLGCGAETLELGPATEIPIEVEYRHGGGSHVALVLLMRKVDASTQAETACGYGGNGRWFDQEDNSLPKKEFVELEDRGWTEAKPENFGLTLYEAPYNPCEDGQSPAMTDLMADETAPGELTVSWLTDIPSTSQLVIRDLATDEMTVTNSDNLLRTRHSVVIGGLSSGTEYAISAFAVSDSLGKGLTRPVKVSLSGKGKH